MNKIKEFFSKSRHYKIESFSIKFSIFFVLLVIIAVAISIFTARKKAESKKTKALYTFSITTSKTKNSGKVLGIYRSEDRNRLFLLWKFDEINNMPQIAEDYSMYLTKSDPYGNLDYLANKPTGGLYLFGNTGYMGAFLVNNGGFEDSVHSLVLRASKELVGGVQDGKVQKGEFMSDASFVKYDQFQIFFNPGVDTIESIDVLNGNELPEANMLFEKLVLRKEEERIRTSLNKSIVDMKFALNRIEETEKRVDLAGMQVPDRPSIIKGDKVVEKGKNLDYMPVYVFVGGYNYDWRSGSVKQGYIENVISNELALLGKKNVNVSKFNILEYNQFFDLKKELSTRFQSRELINKQSTFTLKDGTDLESLKDGDIAGIYADKRAIADGLVNAWDEYVAIKKRYQQLELLDLLRLDLTLKMLKGSITYNGKALIVYTK